MSCAAAVLRYLVSKLSNYNFGNDFSVGNGKCYDCAIRRTLDKQTSAVLWKSLPLRNIEYPERVT
jgi:hypothetical protein